MFADVPLERFSRFMPNPRKPRTFIPSKYTLYTVHAHVRITYTCTLTKCLAVIIELQLHNVTVTRVMHVWSL